MHQLRNRPPARQSHSQTLQPTKTSSLSPALPTQPPSDPSRAKVSSAVRPPYPLLLLPILLIAAGAFYFFLNHSPLILHPPSKPASPNTFTRYPPPDGPWETVARQAVVDAIKYSWDAYASSPAWGADEFYVLSRGGGNLTAAGSIGYFIVDVLDTLLLTGQMGAEYVRARAHIAEHLHFDIDGDVNAFETTIRVLAGLLSAYHLSGFDGMFLQKATDLGNRLLPIFDSPTGIPYSFINLKTGQAKADKDNYGFSSLAEATTLQLEFKYLAKLTNRKTFWDVSEKAMMAIKNAKSHNGLLPILVSPETGQFGFFDIRLGSRGDSYYEYLIKQYLQTNRTEQVYRAMWDEAMTGVKEELVRETPGKLVFTGELFHNGRRSYAFTPKQDHLACFLGGTLMLGVTEGVGQLTNKAVLELEAQKQEDWYLGQELIRTCVDTYERSATGLAPEIVQFVWLKPEEAQKRGGREWVIPNYNRNEPPLDARNILRPETVESLFLAWRATSDPIYREWGWQIFQAFQEHCKVVKNEGGGGGYGSIRDVDRVPAEIDDRMETFWLAETLKYLLLLFSSDEVVKLDEYVLNTEAHLMPIFEPPSFD